MNYLIAKCKFGNIAVVFQNKNINALIFFDTEEEALKILSCIFYKNILNKSFDKEDIIWFQKIIGYIEEPKKLYSVSLNMNGTEFQKKVWNCLLEIPYGKTMSYSQIAIKIGNKNATRAVARACAANKIAYFIPCHRVLRNDGKLSGYRWGVARKQALLKHECVLLS